MKSFIIGIMIVLICVPIAGLIYTSLGAGSFKRMVTLSGIYSICKPDGYPVVCFLDADGKEGGMFCVPLSAIGGECKK